MDTKYRGIVLSDRYGGYNISDRRPQVYWAHLKRDIQVLIDAGGEAKDVGEKLMACLHKVFGHWHDDCRGQIGRVALTRRINNDARSPMWQRLQTGQNSGHGPTRIVSRSV